MAMVTGEITPEGALVDVLVGVSGARRALLERHGFRIPSKITVRAIIDTGAFASAFMPHVFKGLDLNPLGTVRVRTPSTKPGEPHITDEFDVSITLTSGGAEVVAFRIRAILSDDFDSLDDAPQGLVGRDVLNQCAFSYYGHDGKWALGFSSPSGSAS
jgi:hypothetical protein